MPAYTVRIGISSNSIADDGAEVAAAAAQRPEQLGVLVAGGADQLPVGGDELDGEEAVAGEAVAAAEPAEAAAERVADDADVGRGAGQRGEAEPRRREP